MSTIKWFVDDKLYWSRWATHRLTHAHTTVDHISETDRLNMCAPCSLVSTLMACCRTLGVDHVSFIPSQPLYIILNTAIQVRKINPGVKRTFCAIFTRKQSIYQDRLGTNIGKAEGKEAFSTSSSTLQSSRRSGTRAPGQRGATRWSTRWTMSVCGNKSSSRDSSSMRSCTGSVPHSSYR